jgi:hypothetical protein
LVENRNSVLDAVKDLPRLGALVILAGEALIGGLAYGEQSGNKGDYLLAAIFLLFGTLLLVAIVEVVKIVFGGSKPAPATHPKDKTHLGPWSSVWTIEYPSGKTTHDDAPIKDSVQLSRSLDGAVVGKGLHDEEGAYKITGTESDWGFALVYRKSGPSEHILGSIVLEKQRVTNKLSGAWMQISAEGEILKGSTEWKKIS